MKLLHRGTVRRRRAMLVLVVALGFGLVLVLPGAESLAQQGTVGTLKDGGVLRLHLGSTGAQPQDFLAFQEPDPENPGEYLPPGTPQAIGVSSGCRLGPLSGSLVTFSAENGSVGFVGDAIGVRGGGEGNGQPCGRIDGSQKLILDLGPGLDGKLIDFAEIDVELKFAATLSIQGYLVDGEGVASPVGAASTYDSTGSDSGPDSGDNDNYRVRFPEDGSFTAVNRLVLSIVTTGGASLEGGADGTEACDTTDSAACNPGLGQTIDDPDGEAPFDNPTTDSLFHLVEADGVLDCGDTTPQGGGSGTPSYTLERLDNAIDPETGDPEPCTQIPFNLESGADVAPGCFVGSEQCILLEKDLLGQTAQFYWTVTWTPEDANYPESPTEFDFDFDGEFDALKPCLADSDGDGFPQLPPTNPQNPDGPVDPWCITDTFVDFDPDTGDVSVTEVYFGRGDPTGRR
jgi:hypothetical protein